MRKMEVVWIAVATLLAVAYWRKSRGLPIIPAVSAHAAGKQTAFGDKSGYWSDAL